MLVCHLLHHSLSPLFFTIQCRNTVCKQLDPTILTVEGNAEQKPKTNGSLGLAQFMPSGFAVANCLLEDLLCCFVQYLHC